MGLLIYLAQINPTIGALSDNLAKVLQALEQARRQKAHIVLFPELTLTGYPPEDLLLDTTFIDAVEALLPQIAPATQGLFTAVGFPRRNPSRQEKPLFNSAALFADGKLLGFTDKILLPTYDVFDERRFFEPGSTTQPLWSYQGLRIAVTVCEDAWQHSHSAGMYSDYHTDPILYIQTQKPDLLLNLSASPYSYGKKLHRLSIFQAVARTLQCPVALCNQVGANDQLIFDGTSCLLNGQGELITCASSFREDHKLTPLHPISTPLTLQESIQDLYEALVLGIRDYFHKQQLHNAILGLSGGIDSALVACLAQEALGATHVSTLFLPSHFSSAASREDSAHVAQQLGLSYQTISIEPLFHHSMQELKGAFHHSPHEKTLENLQARIRAILLMAYSNESSALMLNTGNKSELAMGYTTLYGDLCGGLGVLLDVTKTQVYELARYANQKHGAIPERVFQRAPSAELKENQTDQETLPPYAVLDPILTAYLEERLSPQDIACKQTLPLPFVQQIVRHIHAAEYKRRQAPIGLRVTSKCFSKGRNVPIVLSTAFLSHN